MNSLFLIGIGAICAMIIVLAVFSDEIIQGQRNMKDNFIRKRKQSLYKITLNGDVSKDFVREIHKGYFTRKREEIELLIFKADMKITYGEYILIAVLCGCVGWMIGNFLNNIMISITLAIMMCFLPKSYLKFVCDSLKSQLNDQLEPVLSQIIGLLPTKKSLISACESCVEGMEEPIKTYIIEFLNNVNNANRSFEEAINDLARKIDSKSFYDFARLAVVHYKQGGDTMYAFNTIPETMRDLKLIQSEQEAELDSLRLLGYLFVFLGPMCYVYYYFTDKQNFEILTDSFAGKVISFIALIITVITIKIIIKISKPVEP